MKINEIIQVALFFGLLIGLTRSSAGSWRASFKARRPSSIRCCDAGKNGLLGRWVDEQAEMTWKGYFLAVARFQTSSAFFRSWV